MTPILALILLAVLKYHTVEGTNGTVVTWTRAEEICQDRGGVVVPLTVDEQIRLASKVKQNGSIWINVEKKKYSEMTWINSGGMWLGLLNTQHGTCGCLGIYKYERQMCRCREKQAATLCQLAHSDPVCDGIKSPYTHLYIKPDCFFVIPDFTDWFSARTRCTALGGDLAVVRSAEQYKALVDKVEALQIKDVRDFWIGFSLYDWVTSSDGAAGSLKVGFWAENSPDITDTKNCAILNGSMWVPVDCMEQHRVICQNDFMIRPGSNYTTTSAPCVTHAGPHVTPDCGPSFLIAFIVILVFFIILLVVVGGCLYKICRDVSDEERKEYKNEEQRESFMANLQARSKK